jgi:hypothetical protein
VNLNAFVFVPPGGSDSLVRRVIQSLNAGGSRFRLMDENEQDCFGDDTKEGNGREGEITEMSSSGKFTERNEEESVDAEEETVKILEVIDGYSSSLSSVSLGMVMSPLWSSVTEGCLQESRSIQSCISYWLSCHFAGTNY